MDGEITVAAFLSLVFGFVGGVFLSAKVNGDSWRREAVEKGHAEYVLKGDEAVWQWKPITKEAERD